ncbi:MAG: gliding motility-associated C-terminal domain-containing protein [Taibaiella sp.]|nr:gliding motility-associated C-terminal domain-containing protein [Taibaiella sp.]
MPFSPNGDGLNDRFEIKNKCHEFLQYRLQVYDRWGRVNVYIL